MLKGKCLLLQTVLIFPSANRALTLESLMQPVETTPDWGRAGVIGPLIFGKHIKTTAMLQQTPGAFKNQRPKGGCSSPQRAHAFDCPNVRSQCCHHCGVWGKWFFSECVSSPVKSHKRHEATSAPHTLVPTLKGYVCMCVCACVRTCVCTHCASYRLFSGDHWCCPPGNSVGEKVWQRMHTDGSAAGARESDF